MLKSWKTTLSGVLAFIAATSAQFQTLLDNDPATNPEWNIILAALLALVGLASARDNDVTSEEAKSK